jgi:hypothetical protein
VVTAFLVSHTYHAAACLQARCYLLASCAALMHCDKVVIESWPTCCYGMMLQRIVCTTMFRESCEVTSMYDHHESLAVNHVWVSYVVRIMQWCLGGMMPAPPAARTSTAAQRQQTHVHCGAQTSGSTRCLWHCNHLHYVPESTSCRDGTVQKGLLMPAINNHRLCRKSRSCLMPANTTASVNH